MNQNDRSDFNYQKGIVLESSLHKERKPLDLTDDESKKPVELGNPNDSSTWTLE